jgi:hypothetical protein
VVSWALLFFALVRDGNIGKTNKWREFMTFQQTLNKHFPNAMLEADFVKHTYLTLLDHGFDKVNTIACAGLCHDEVTRSLRDEIRETWGEVFNLSSMAGILFIGKAGFGTVNQDTFKIRVPSGVDEGERYVIYTMPHITIGSSGEIGLCQRPSRAGASSACGALVAFRRELASGYLSIELDPHDKKENRLKQNLFRKVKSGQIPSLVNLVKLTHQIILEDLKHMIDLVASLADTTHHPLQCNYAIFGGVQIHGPDQKNYVWPGESIVAPLNSYSARRLLI